MTVEDWECLVCSFPHPVLLNCRQWNPPAPCRHSLQIGVRKINKRQKKRENMYAQKASLILQCVGCLVPLGVSSNALLSSSSLCGSRDISVNRRDLSEKSSADWKETGRMFPCARGARRNTDLNWHLFNWFHASSSYLISRPSLAATVYTVEARIQTTILAREQLLIWKTAQRKEREKKSGYVLFLYSYSFFQFCKWTCSLTLFINL